MKYQNPPDLGAGAVAFVEYQPEVRCANVRMAANAEARPMTADEMRAADALLLRVTALSPRYSR